MFLPHYVTRVELQTTSDLLIWGNFISHTFFSFILNKINYISMLPVVFLWQRLNKRVHDIIPRLLNGRELLDLLLFFA